MHLYLRLVNESGDSLIEPEKGFLSMDWICCLRFSEVTNNPDTEGKPRSITLYLCFINVIHLSLMLYAFK
jgi:hypothetical protein